MAKQINKEQVLSLIEEANSATKVSGQTFRTIKRVMETTDDTDIIEAVLSFAPIAWIALKREDLPIESILRVFPCIDTKCRQEVLRSQYGAFVYENLSDEFTYSDYTAFIGSKYIDIDTHDEMMDKHWIMNRIVFIDSKHLLPLDVIMIAKDIIASDLNTMQAKLGTGRTFRGVEDTWSRLLDNPAVDETIIRKLFELKDYYCDSSLMTHRKTPQDLKDEIKQIMDNHHSKQ